MRLCIACKQEKDLNSFYISSKNKDGFEGTCKQCKREKAKIFRSKNRKDFSERQQKRRQKYYEYFAKLKEFKPCADCNNFYPHYVMQFDHIIGNKRNDISRMILQGNSIETILLETKKCELVCSNCHASRTFHRIKQRNKK